VSARRVIGNRDCNGTSTITRETAYCVLTNAGAITAAKPRGAYGPALVRARSPTGGIATFAMHERTFVKSGGRQPAVAIGNRSCEDNSAHIRTPPSREASGAASISPPWFGERTCNGTSTITREPAYCVLTNAGAITAAKPRGDLRPPLLFAHVRPPTELRLLRSTNADVPGAAGVSPPWFGEPRMQGKSQIASHRGFVQPQERLASARRESGTALAGECDSRRWTNHVRSGGREAAVGRETHLQERFRKVAGDCRRWRTNVGAITFVKPRGLTSPALVRAHSLADGIATFAMHNRTSKKSGGCKPAVSRESLMRGQFRTHSHTAVARSVRSGEHQPAVGRETHLQERFRKVPGDCRRWLTNVGAITFVQPRGAYAPRSCFAHVRPPTELRLLRSTNADVPGAAGVSPPWVGNRTC